MYEFFKGKVRKNAFIGNTVKGQQNALLGLQRKVK